MIHVFTRLRVRILSIVLLAIIPAICLIWYSAEERKAQISEDIETNALRLSRFLASNLERDVLQGQGYLKAAARLLGPRMQHPDSCRSQLASLLDESSVYANLGLAGEDGSVLCSASPVPRGSGLDSLEWFRKARDSSALVVGFDFRSILSYHASINLGLALEPAPGVPRRILFAVMSLDWLGTLAEDARLPAGSALSVTNRRGDAVMRYPDPEKWVGKPYPEELLAEDRLPGWDGVRLSKGIDGVERLYAYSTVKGRGNFMVRIGIRREAAYAEARKVLLRQLSALGMVSLLAILAAWYGADLFLLKQVRALIQATKRLADGDLGARSSLSYDRGELGELARSFDDMAEKLEWREAQLRESEIERANPINQLGELLELAPEASLLLDDRCDVVYANRPALELFAAGEGGLSGKTGAELCPDLSPDMCERNFPPPERGKARAIRRLRSVARKSDGGTVPLEVALSRSSMNKQTVYVAILRFEEKNNPNG